MDNAQDTVSSAQEPRQGLSPVKVAICERIASGDTLEEICQGSAMPTRMTVWRWRNLDADFNDTFTRAQQSAACVYGDKVKLISDKLANGQGDWAKDRAAMDGYKWLASKFYRKMFGEESPRSLHQTYVAGDVTLVADEGKRQAMIEARAKFLDKGNGIATDTESDVSLGKD